MVGPTSARFAAGVLFAVSVMLLLMCCHGYGWRRGPNKKPTTVSSRGFLSKFKLTTTSANGVAFYNDDDQCNLSVVF
jgi:hypothetical protein